MNLKSWLYFKKVRQPITSELQSKVDNYIQVVRAKRFLKIKNGESTVLGDFEVIAFLDFLDNTTLSDFTV